LRGQALLKIKEGDKRTLSKTITEQDMRDFATLTGDFNPIHLDDKFAEKTMFKGKIAHGILIAGLISAALSKFPGVIIYLSQNLRFPKPVRAGEVIEATAEVMEKVEERSELKLKTTCRNQRDEIVVEGEAQIMVLELEE
jgi:3-hydroxybutyryl-CoA dehydratase